MALLLEKLPEWLRKQVEALPPWLRGRLPPTPEAAERRLFYGLVLGVPPPPETVEAPEAVPAPQAVASAPASAQQAGVGQQSGQQHSYSGQPPPGTLTPRDMVLVSGGWLSGSRSSVDAGSAPEKFRRLAALLSAAESLSDVDAALAAAESMGLRVSSMSYSPGIGGAWRVFVVYDEKTGEYLAGVAAHGSRYAEKLKLWAGRVSVPEGEKGVRIGIRCGCPTAGCHMDVAFLPRFTEEHVRRLAGMLGLGAEGSLPSLQHAIAVKLAERRGTPLPESFANWYAGMDPDTFIRKLRENGLLTEEEVKKLEEG
ncbi:MAG: hypothetical protein QXI55_06125 [Thermofilum sp.]